MGKNSQRVLGLMLVLILILVLTVTMAGCGGSSNGSPTSPTPPDTPVAYASGAQWAEAPVGLFTVRTAPGVVYNNLMWVIGGVDSSDNKLNDVWYSSDGANWKEATGSSGATFPGRYSHTSVNFNNTIWVIGGINESETYFLNDVWYAK
jgi:uncharacterized protein YceK